jgi:hypothetical protein
MTTKKKRTKREEVRIRMSALAALNSLTHADTRPALDELARLRVRLAAMEEITAAQDATMGDHAAVVMELNEKLADLQRQLAAKEKELERDDRAFVAFGAERDFLWEEIDRFRNRVMDYIRWETLLPEDVRAALQKVRAQQFADEREEDDEKP